MGRSVGQWEDLEYGSTHWQNGQLFGLLVNPLANGITRINSFWAFGFSFRNSTNFVVSSFPSTVLAAVVRTRLVADRHFGIGRQLLTAFVYSDIVIILVVGDNPEDTWWGLKSAGRTGGVKGGPVGRTRRLQDM
jgi:hypothetical protein